MKYFLYAAILTWVFSLFTPYMIGFSFGSGSHDQYVYGFLILLFGPLWLTQMLIVISWFANIFGAVAIFWIYKKKKHTSVLFFSGLALIFSLIINGSAIFPSTICLDICGPDLNVVYGYFLWQVSFAFLFVYSFLQYLKYKTTKISI